VNGMRNRRTVKATVKLQKLKFGAKTVKFTSPCFGCMMFFSLWLCACASLVFPVSHGTVLNLKQGAGWVGNARSRNSLIILSVDQLDVSFQSRPNISMPNDDCDTFLNLSMDSIHC
jgi:hypothetical protein